MTAGRGSRGAVFPLYIWMITGLLTVAFLFFVFAQAAVTRSGGQSAADAAALAAAREARDQLFDDFQDALGDEDGDLEDILDGGGSRTAAPCSVAAPRFAERNGAEVVACAADEASLSYTVRVRTLEPVGESLIPSTSDAYAEAEATAVVESRCALASADEDRVEFRCAEGRDWTFDPEDEDELPEARDMFHVFLED
ncbi:pilus assembly protein TadG-related protein [Streptomyces sp. DSM 44915]|uniref:Pilus assembly protein TadG-related protein n=1 Tax=Streptomyces chisholmiae TaxID=3075540 RepID=A0ABU2JL10_9ACTN|nr:pilus assembly protein TadG-related protein [Streptomyces sp. DSM 44915]MDT0265389.1 pilus assembly protein TadG-related protein [Streptomyces sp. DSM 44915]